jgi:hypothetical protein
VCLTETLHLGMHIFGRSTFIQLVHLAQASSPLLHMLVLHSVKLADLKGLPFKEWLGTPISTIVIKSVSLSWAVVLWENIHTYRERDDDPSSC